MSLLKITSRAILLFLVFGFQPLPAQQIWSLQQCVDYAVKNNLSVRQSDATSRLQEVEVTRSKWAQIPSFNGNMSTSWNVGRSIDPTTNLFTEQEIQGTSLGLNGNWILFDGFQVRNGLKNSKLEYMATQYDLQKVKNDISLNVVSEYMQMLYAKEQLTLADDLVKVAQEQSDRTAKLVAAGTLPRGNQLDAESQLANEELNRVTAQNQLAFARLNLVQLLQLDSAGGFDISDPKPALPEEAILLMSPEQIYQLSLTHLPELKSAQTRIEVAENNLRISKGAQFPTLSAFGSLGSNASSAARNLDSLSYQGLVPNGSQTSSGDVILAPVYTPNFSDQGFFDQIENNLNRAFGFSLTIPILNGMNTRSNIRRQEIGIEQARIRDEETRRGVLTSIQQAHNDATAARKRYEALQKSDTALEEAYTYAEKRYSNGLTSSLEYNTARNNLSRAKVQLLQAKYDYIFRLKVLDFYAGNPLVF